MDSKQDKPFGHAGAVRVRQYLEKSKHRYFKSKILLDGHDSCIKWIPIDAIRVTVGLGQANDMSAVSSLWLVDWYDLNYIRH